MKHVILSAILCLSLSGCAAFQTYSYNAEPPIAKSVSDKYEIQLQPIPCNSYSGCQGFNLTLANKSNSDIEIDWNKSLFVVNGQTNGGFMFEGTVYKDRNNSKDPDVVFANSTFSKNIFPNSLVSYNTTLNRWLQAPMYNGEYGAYLRLKIDGKEQSPKLTTKIIATPN
ncbi:hypothetical protein [Vogesella indigofera]|uniref:Lipoprotein n=1 Tax=Vogesella indigofera TaxID=45465 RepID=A0ABT5I8H4_VOGIN|nr:hypothetical protein [Vogesella indigofera]MDC7692465.1 hypothetical protein [Vogesella indigofera]